MHACDTFLGLNAHRRQRAVRQQPCKGPRAHASTQRRDACRCVRTRATRIGLDCRHVAIPRGLGKPCCACCVSCSGQVQAAADLLGLLPPKLLDKCLALHERNGGVMAAAAMAAAMDGDELGSSGSSSSSSSSSSSATAKALRATCRRLQDFLDDSIQRLSLCSLLKLVTTTSKCRRLRLAALAAHSSKSCRSSRSGRPCSNACLA